MHAAAHSGTVSRANSNPAARDLAAGHGECASYAHTAAKSAVGRAGNFAALDASLLHGERFARCYTHAAALGTCSAAHDTAALHGEKIIFSGGSAYIHTAAFCCGAAHDIAASHNELAASLCTHATAICCLAAGDDAATNGFIAAVVQHPQSRGIFLEPVFRIRITVAQCQRISVHSDLLAVQVQYLAVQIQCNIASGGYRFSQCHIFCQLDSVKRAVIQRFFQLIRRGDFRYRRIGDRHPRPLRALHRRSECLRGGFRFLLRLSFRLLRFFLRLLLWFRLGFRCFRRRDVFLAGFQRSAFRTADGAVCVHALLCASRLAAAHGRFRNGSVLPLLGESRRRQRGQHHTA